MGDETTLDCDLLCVGCGYNLRGLADGRKCPECNTSISRSRLGRELRFSHPKWLQKLRWGVTLLQFVFLFSACFPVLALLAFPFPFAAFLWDLYFGIVFVVVPICGSLGILLVTSVEPRLASEWKQRWSRRISRMCLLIAVGLGVTILLMELLWRTVVPGTLSGQFISSVIGLAACFALGAVIATLICLSDVLERIPGDDLSVTVRKRAWRFGFCAAAVLINPNASVGTTMAPPTGWGMALSLMTGIFSLLFVVYGIALMLDLMRARTAIKSVIAVAVPLDTD